MLGLCEVMREKNVFKWINAKGQPNYKQGFFSFLFNKSDLVH